MRADRHDLAPADFAGVDESPVRCLDPEASAAMVEEINRLRKANESLGGVFEVRAFGLVPGLGSHVSWEERLDGRLGGAILSIQAMKGVGIGEGFDLAGKPGSEAHDEIFFSEERGYYRETNRAGGLEGGMTTGEPLGRPAAMKPLPTLTKPLRSVDIATKEPAAGAARAHRLDDGPGGRRGGRGDGRVRARRRLPREVRRRPHRRRARRGARLRGADRMAAADGAAGALVFIGFMGAGKTTAARDVAEALGTEAVDTDALLEERLGMPIAEFFEREGEPAFRTAEEEVVLEALERSDGAPIALGGGAVMSARVREALQPPTRVILLEVRGVGVGAPSRRRPRPLARDRRVRRTCTPSARALYESLADAILPATAASYTFRDPAGAAVRSPAPRRDALVPRARRATTPCSSGRRC